MSLFRPVIANPVRRFLLAWISIVLLFGVLAAISGSTAFASVGFDPAVAATTSAALLSGDRESPSPRIADECTEALKRRRVSADWLAVVVGNVGDVSARTLPPILSLALATMVLVPAVDPIDAFDVEPRDWSSTRLRVCLGRAPPLA